MNRYARIMHAVGWLAALLWIAAWIQGRGVATDGPELGLHTMLALTAAAATLLSRAWTVVFLLLGGERFAEPAARRRRIVALLLATLALTLLTVHFALSGSMLWRRISVVQHALLGGGLILAHVVALGAEWRALAARERPGLI
jgi:hypothetical protein